jgi:plastocyanin
VPACWRNPSGVIGGGGGTTPTAAPVASPGTAANPRVVAVDETAGVTITDPSGNKLSSIAVVPGETVKFQVTNTAGFDHNFYVGAAPLLVANNVTNLPGVPAFPSGTKEFTYTVPQTDDGTLQFACTLLGHYETMHGKVELQAGGAPAPSAAPGTSAAPVESGAPASLAASQPPAPPSAAPSNQVAPSAGTSP